MSWVTMSRAQLVERRGVPVELLLQLQELPSLGYRPQPGGQLAYVTACEVRRGSEEWHDDAVRLQLVVLDGAETRELVFAWEEMTAPRLDAIVPGDLVSFRVELEKPELWHHPDAWRAAFRPTQVMGRDVIAAGERPFPTFIARPQPGEQNVELVSRGPWTFSAHELVVGVTLREVLSGLDQSERALPLPAWRTLADEVLSACGEHAFPSAAALQERLCWTLAGQRRVLTSPVNAHRVASRAPAVPASPVQVASEVLLPLMAGHTAAGARARRGSLPEGLSPVDEDRVRGLLFLLGAGDFGSLEALQEAVREAVPRALPRYDALGLVFSLQPRFFDALAVLRDTPSLLPRRWTALAEDDAPAAFLGWVDHWLERRCDPRALPARVAPAARPFSAPPASVRSATRPGAPEPESPLERLVERFQQLLKRR